MNVKETYAAGPFGESAEDDSYGPKRVQVDHDDQGRPGVALVCLGCGAELFLVLAGETVEIPDDHECKGAKAA